MRRLGVLVTLVGLAASGCTSVRVQVPPEADLAGIKTVAVQATDLPGDPTPVAVLLRSEASNRILRLLPTLTLVDPSAGADALLRLSVIRHGTTPPSVRIHVDPRTRRLSCAAWHTASLLVDAAVLGGPTIRWQGILEAGRRIDLPCVRRGDVWIPVLSAADYDTRLVQDVMDDLGRRLAGFVRTELRAIRSETSPAQDESAPDRP